MNLQNKTIANIGMSCVGLPLAFELGKHLDTIVFNINPTRTAELQSIRVRA